MFLIYYYIIVTLNRIRAYRMSTGQDEFSPTPSLTKGKMDSRTNINEMSLKF